MKIFNENRRSWSTASILCLFIAASACKESEAPKAPAKKAEPAPAKATPPPKEEAKPAKPTPEQIRAIRNKKDDDGIVRRGKKLSPKEEVTVALAFAKAAEIDGEFMKVTGTVADTSGNGCTFVLKEGTNEIKVTSASCSMLVPEKADGMRATVEGTASVKETKGDDGAVTREMKVTAVGLELRDAG